MEMAGPFPFSPSPVDASHEQGRATSFERWVISFERHSARQQRVRAIAIRAVSIKEQHNVRN